MRDIANITPEIRKVRDEIRELEFRTRPILGSNIQAYRKKLNLSQAELAQRLGRSRTSIIYVETGEMEITMPMFLKICEILSVSPNQLLKEKKCSSEKRATSTRNSGSTTS